MTDDLGIMKEKLKIEVLSGPEEPSHFHQNVELIFVLEGKLDVTVSDQVTRLPEDGVLLINSNRRHALKGGEDVLCMKLTIQWQMISDVLKQGDVLFWCNSTLGEDERYQRLRGVLRKILMNYVSTGGDTTGFRHISLCYQVMDLLASDFMVSQADQPETTGRVDTDERISQINRYLRSGYRDAVSLKGMADYLHLSCGYLSRFFTKQYGMSFTGYLEELRLHYATEELLNTDKTITQIAFDNGFPGPAAFDRAFGKKNGVTPTQFRKSQAASATRKKEEENKERIRGRLAGYLAGAAPEEAVPDTGRITVDLNAGTESSMIRSTRSDTINAGAASDLLRSEMQEHLLLLRDMLGFRYVRFWDLFSEEMLLDRPSADGHWNFSRLDAVLDFLLGNGLLPHFEIGSKPKRIMARIRQPVVPVKKHEEFADPARLQTVREMMDHLVRQYGSSIDSWRFEVWYPEDRREKEEDQCRYIRYFDQIYAIIHACSDTVRVGGCGILLNSSDAQISAFLRLWERDGARKPDFLSGIIFNYEIGTESGQVFARRSTDPEYILHSLQKFRRVAVSCGFDGVPRVVSEWNLSISDRNWMNDTCYKGAYIVKNMIDIYGEVQNIIYFYGTDRMTEFYDSGQLLYGASGLLTKDGIPKPALYAFQMIGMLYPYVQDRGRNYLVSRNRAGDYGILCHNQRPLGSQYYLTPENELDRSDMWRYFDDRERRELTFRISGLVTGEIYRTRILRMEPDEGSILRLWRDTAFDKDFTREDRALLKSRSCPILQIYKNTVVKGELQIRIGLKANEFALLEIRKERKIPEGRA